MKRKTTLQKLDGKLMIGLSIVLENDEPYQKFHEHLAFNRLLSRLKNIANYNDKMLNGLQYTLKVNSILEQIRNLVEIALLDNQLKEKV